MTLAVKVALNANTTNQPNKVWYPTVINVMLEAGDLDRIPTLHHGYDLSPLLPRRGSFTGNIENGDIHKQTNIQITKQKGPTTAQEQIAYL